MSIVIASSRAGALQHRDPLLDRRIRANNDMMPLQSMTVPAIGCGTCRFDL
jgi:hypothetical protein